MLLSYRDHTFVRIFSTRTDEVLFEIKMLDGAMSATLREPLGSCHNDREVQDAEVSDRGELRR